MMATTLDPHRRPTPRAYGIAVSDAVELVFQKALALDPRTRHPDAGAFWDDLERALVAPKAAAAPLFVPRPPSHEPLPLPPPSALQLSYSVNRRPSQSRAKEIRPAFDWSKLTGSVVLFIVGLLIAAAVHAYAASSGHVLGPISWVGSALAILGLLRGVWIYVRSRID